MFSIIKDLAGKAKETISTTTDLVGDVLERDDVRAAAENFKKTATTVGQKAAQLGKEAAQSDIAKDAGSAAAVGAVMGVPIPLIGPMAGATVGATLGVYKNLTRKEQPLNASTSEQPIKVDLYSEMLKLDDLRQRGIISDDEFSSMKGNLLNEKS
jgi:hypothetical protein